MHGGSSSRTPEGIRLPRFAGPARGYQSSMSTLAFVIVAALAVIGLIVVIGTV
jgi:hypothetical protein